MLLPNLFVVRKMAKEKSAIISDERRSAAAEMPSERVAPISKGLLWGPQANLFNKKEFSEIKQVVDLVEQLVEEEKDKTKKVLDEINSIISKDREEKREREKELRKYISEVSKKVTFISEQTAEKEIQLKKEIDVLQQSIRMIQSNLAFGAKGGSGKGEGEGEVIPSLISREEVEKLKETVRNIKQLLDDEKTREKSIDKDFDGAVLEKDELMKSWEAELKKQVGRVNSVVKSIALQTAEKELQLKKEIDILQQSIRLIRERLPTEEEGYSPEPVAPKSRRYESTAEEEPTEEGYERQEVRRPTYEEEEDEPSGLEIEIETESEEEPKQEPKRKQQKKGFFQFMRK